MTSPLETPRREFADDLNRLKSLLELLNRLRAFSGESESRASVEHDFYMASLALRDAVRARGAEMPILSGTLLLYVAGRFEHFARDTFEVLCDSISARCSRLNELPAKMRDQLIQLTAEVVGSPGKYGFDQIDVHGFVVTLSANIQATTGLGQINTRCLSVTSQNMNAAMLAELFKRAGVDNLWSEMGKQAPLKLWFTLNEESQVTKQAKSQLDQLMSLRNRIAHPTGDTTFPDLEQVLGYIDFLRVLAEVLVSVVNVSLATFQPAEVALS